MRLPIIGIYSITSPTGRIYIGQSWDIKCRWRHHRNDHRSDGLLQRSIRKHGFNAHVFNILMSLPPSTTQDDLNQLEQIFIREHKERGRSLLNLTEGGCNAKLTDEHKDKIRKALTGYVRTEEHRRRISESKKGIPRTEEWKQRVSKTLKGRPATWLKGKKLSLEVVTARAARQRGRKLSPEHRENMRLAQLRRWENWRVAHV